MNSMKIGKQVFQTYDVCVFLFGFWNLLLFFGRGLIDGEYDWTALTVLSLSVFYFAVRELKKIKELQLDILLVVCSFLCEMVLWHYIVNPEINFGLGFLIEDCETLASFSLFVLCLASVGYCGRQKKRKRFLYMVMAVISSLCLFISCEIAAIWLGGIVFLLIPLLMKSTVGRVKRVIELICMYLGLFGFIPLADFWLELFRTKLIYHLEDSVYLYLVFSVTAVGFMDWWDKRKEEPGRMVKEFQGLCGYLLCGILIGVFFQSGLRENGTMVQCMQKYKAAGCVFLVIFVLVAAKRLYVKYLTRRSVRPIFGLVSIVFLIQSAFFKQQPAMALVYIVFLSTALQYKVRGEKEKKVENEKEKRTKKSETDNSDSAVISAVCAGESFVCESNGAG